VSFKLRLVAGQVGAIGAWRGGDPRRACPATIAKANEWAEREGVPRGDVASHVERAERDGAFASLASSGSPATGPAIARHGVSSTSGTPNGEGVTRQGQNPGGGNRSEVSQGLNRGQGGPAEANLPVSASPAPRGDASSGAGERRADAAGDDPELDLLLGSALKCVPYIGTKIRACACGAGEAGRCDLCETGLSGLERAFQRWDALGQPDDASYRARFGCACSCHGGEHTVCFCVAEDSLKCINVRTRMVFSGLGGWDVADWIGKPRAPRILPPLPTINEPKGEVVDPLEEAHASRAAEATRRRDELARWNKAAISRPAGPPRSGRMLLCSCDCHESNDPDPQCGCPRPGILKRYRQRRAVAERRARSMCANETTPDPAIPLACRCQCHVLDCCKTSDGPRRDHSHHATDLFSPCGCTEHGAEVCAIRSRGPRILATQIDTLHLSFRVELDEGFLEDLRAKKKDAQENKGRRVLIKLPGVDAVLWTVTPGSGGSVYAYRLTNEFADLCISTVKRSKDAMQLRFELRAGFLWERQLEGAWAWCLGIAGALNKGERCPVSKLTRLDMCMDVVGIDFAEADEKHFVSRARRRTRHYGRASQGDRCPACAGSGTCPCCEGEGILENPAHLMFLLDVHASGLKESGLSLGAGAVGARIYDKTREIREKSRDKAWLYDFWAARGWVSTETVWRVEIQFRRPALKELVSERTLRTLGLDELDGCRAALSSLWGYAVGGAHARGHTAWLKWCVPNPDDSRRSRWDARPEWKIVQAAEWLRDEVEPVELVRKKVKAAQLAVIWPQFAGLATTVAAFVGPATRRPNMFDEEEVGEPTLADMDQLLLQHVRATPARGTWTERVDKRRAVLSSGELPNYLTDDQRLERAKRDHERAKEKRQRRAVMAMALG
jgi:hypothetical protein